MPQLTRLLSACALALCKLSQEHLHADVLNVLLKFLMHLDQVKEVCNQTQSGPLAWYPLLCLPPWVPLTCPICTWVSSTEWA